MFTVETYDVQGTSKSFLWLRCDTCITGLVSLPLSSAEEYETVKDACLKLASERQWALAPLCRCPLCVADNWTDPIH